MILVLDNSIVMRWFFGDGKPGNLAYAGRVLEALEADRALVPATWCMEAANVIARAQARGIVTEARSAAFLGLLQDLDIEVDPDTVQHALSSTLQLARRYGLSAYDASYLELALRKAAPLATLDEGLQRAAKRAGAARFR